MDGWMDGWMERSECEDLGKMDWVVSRLMDLEWMYGWLERMECEDAGKMDWMASQWIVSST